jgi:hypothetical protein
VSDVRGSVELGSGYSTVSEAVADFIDETRYEVIRVLDGNGKVMKTIQSA